MSSGGTLFEWLIRCGRSGRADGFFRGLQRCRIAAVKLLDPLLDEIERGVEPDDRIARGDLSAAGFDGADLGIDQIANPAVGTDFPQPPGNLPDDPGALADRGQRLLQRHAVDRRRRGGPGFIDRVADGCQRLGEAAFGNRWRLPLGGKTLFYPFDRIEHHAGVGIAVALGIFAEKPAASRRLHERFADRIIILFARLGRARGDRR